MSEVERIALAICEADCGRITENELARCRDLAQAAIAALDEARAEQAMRDLAAGVHITKDGKRIAPDDFYLPAPPKEVG